jgi:hypothetical protein
MSKQTRTIDSERAIVLLSIIHDTNNSIEFENVMKATFDLNKQEYILEFADLETNGLITKTLSKGKIFYGITGEWNMHYTFEIKTWLEERGYRNP